MSEAISAFRGYSDAAKRCSDTISLHASAGSVLRWAAIRLSDGGSDGVPYDSRADAIRHQLWEQQCVYICIQPGGMTPQEAETYLKFYRSAYDAGYRMADPDSDVSLIMPIRNEAVNKAVRRLKKLEK